MTFTGCHPWQAAKSRTGWGTPIALGPKRGPSSSNKFSSYIDCLVQPAGTEAWAPHNNDFGSLPRWAQSIAAPRTYSLGAAQPRPRLSCGSRCASANPDALLLQVEAIGLCAPPKGAQLTPPQFKPPCTACSASDRRVNQPWLSCCSNWPGALATSLSDWALELCKVAGSVELNS